ncbi:MAG: PLDc_N domain-containing protein [Candidatus Magasanikbacteria bacterium]|nr:PLDc_N domain-containing protein [Candidatus Magasanikbacteria bacterium]
MRSLYAWFVGLFVFLASAQSAYAAQCTLNGKEVPCGEMPPWFWGVTVILSVIGVAGFVFWLWMLVDAIKHEKENKTMWVVLLIFLNLLGAIIYYVVAKRKRPKISDQGEQKTGT